MERAEVRFRARFVLKAFADGGRLAPVRSGYRPSFGFTADEEMLHDASVVLVERDVLTPGESTDVDLIPTDAGAWDRVKRGQTLYCYEGVRLVGEAVVQQRSKEQE